MMRGESLEIVSRDLGVTAARLSEWRDQFHAGVEGAVNLRANLFGPFRVSVSYTHWTLPTKREVEYWVDSVHDINNQDLNFPIILLF